MRQFATTLALVGEGLTLINFGDHWGFVPSYEVRPLPRLWPFFNRIRSFFVDVFNLFFLEVKTEVTVPIGTKVLLTLGTRTLVEMFEAGQVRAVVATDGFQIDDHVYEFQLFGDWLGVEVLRLPPGENQG